MAEIEHWQDRFRVAAENALRNRPKDEEALKDAQIKQLKQKVGELVLDLDILKEALKGRPFRPEDIRRVGAAVPGASACRACRVVQVPRTALRATRGGGDPRGRRVP